MRKPAVVGAVSILALLGGTALSGCEAGGDSGSTSTPEDEACASWAAAYCERVDQCSNYNLRVRYGDRVTCMARLEPHCRRMFDLPAVTITASDLRACAEAYSDESCDRIYPPTPKACRFAGELDNGASCSAAAQCQSGQCYIPYEGVCGTCGTILLTGDACGADDYCADGSYCDHDTGKCERPPGRGEACDWGCDGVLLCQDQVCVDPLPTGAVCSGEGFECGFTEDVFCNPQANRCQKVDVAPFGGGCEQGSPPGTFARCRGDQWCDYETDLCYPRLEEGFSCTLDSRTGFSTCAPGLQCIEGRCSSGYPTCQ